MMGFVRSGKPALRPVPSPRNPGAVHAPHAATAAAGAVAAVTIVKNPISLARAVMEKSPHVMMSGPGAEEFEEGVALPAHRRPPRRAARTRCRSRERWTAAIARSTSQVRT